MAARRSPALPALRRALSVLLRTATRVDRVRSGRALAQPSPCAGLLRLRPLSRLQALDRGLAAIRVRYCAGECGGPRHPPLPGGGPASGPPAGWRTSGGAPCRPPIPVLPTAPGCAAARNVLFTGLASSVVYKGRQLHVAKRRQRGCSNCFAHQAARIMHSQLARKARIFDREGCKTGGFCSTHT